MQTNVYRGRLLAVLALAGGLIVFGGMPSVALELTVGKAAPNADPIIPINVGDKLGIFKKHGFDLKIVDLSGGGKMAQALAAGSIDIGDGAGTEMALVAKGVPMIAVCQTAGPVPFLSIGVPLDSPIRTIADLKGKKIGVSTSGSLTDWLTKELARTQGWAPNDVTAVAIGNGVTTIIAAFRGNLVDADVSTTSLFLSMEEQKTGRLLFPVTKFAGNMAAGALYASKKLIDSNPGAIRDFVAAWMETIAYMRAHKAETVKIESEITGFSETVMAREYDLVRDMYTTDCKFDAESLATLKRSFVDLKLLNAPPDMTTIYTHEFLPK